MNFFNQLECTMVNGEIPYKYQTNKQKTIKGNKSYSLNLFNRSWRIWRQKIQSRLLNSLN